VQKFEQMMGKLYLLTLFYDRKGIEIFVLIRIYLFDLFYSVFVGADCSVNDR
jgi:hypothetical protein